MIRLTPRDREDRRAKHTLARSPPYLHRSLRKSSESGRHHSHKIGGDAGVFCATYSISIGSVGNPARLNARTRRRSDKGVLRWCALKNTAQGAETAFSAMKLLRNTWDNITLFNQTPQAALEILIRDMAALNNKGGDIFKCAVM